MAMNEFYKKETEERSAPVFTVGVIGLGNMGRAITEGIAANENFSGQLIICNRTKEQTLLKFDENIFPRVRIAEDNAEVAKQSHVLFVSLKQAQMQEELTRWRECGQVNKDSLLVSFAAGITIDTIKKWIGNKKQAVARVMPNTPAAVGEGVYGWAVSDEVTKGQMTQLKKLLGGIGTEIYVERESDIDIVTALSGSGPAYFYLQAEKMIETAVAMGLSKEQAEMAGRKTLIGAAALLAAHPEVSLSTLRQNITSKGGTTEAALKSFLANGLD